MLASKREASIGTERNWKNINSQVLAKKSNKLTIEAMNFTQQNEYVYIYTGMALRLRLTRGDKSPWSNIEDSSRHVPRDKHDHRMLPSSSTWTILKHTTLDSTKLHPQALALTRTRQKYSHSKRHPTLYPNLIDTHMADISVMCGSSK